MRRSLPCVLSLLLLASASGGSTPEPFRPKGLHNNAVHRYFPDLDARLNAVRYGRWRALEIAWLSGINPKLDRRFSSYLLALLADPPRYPPEAERVAPRLAREAAQIFHALSWGQMLEQQLSDALASPDASPALTLERLRRALEAYRREPYALSQPKSQGPGPAPETARQEAREGPQTLVLEAARAAPVSAKILLAGTALFVQTAEDLAGADFGEQRWRVRETISEFDQSFAGGFGKNGGARSAETGAARPDTPGAIRPLTYGTSAPTVAKAFPSISQHLDLLARFRMEVFEALISGGETEQARRQRDSRLREVAWRYRLTEYGIGARN